MRAELYKRVAPLAAKLASELTDMLAVDVERLVAKVEIAFDTALSAFASDLSVTDGAARLHDVRDDEGESRSATQPRSQAISRPVDNRSARGSRGEHEDRASDAAASETRSGREATNVSSSYRALQQGKDLPPSTSSGRKPNSCRKCGAIGFTSATCGKTHNVSTSPAEEEDGEGQHPSPKKKHRPAGPPATSPINPPPLVAPIVSLSSRRPPRSAAPAKNVPPEGWSPEADRAEEWTALGELTLNRKR